MSNVSSQSIHQILSLFDIHVTVNLRGIERPDRSPRNNLPIAFQHPLAHFIALSPCWSKHSPQDFLLVGKGGRVFSEVSTFISSKLTGIGTVSFIPKSQIVWARSIELEVTLGRKVEDPSSVDFPLILFPRVSNHLYTGRTTLPR
jgi:hypothetical protein